MSSSASTTSSRSSSPCSSESSLLSRHSYDEDDDAHHYDSKPSASLSTNHQLNSYDVIVEPDDCFPDDFQGNHHFYRLIYNNRAIYQATQSEGERTDIIQSIIGSTQQDGGRFFKNIAKYPRSTETASNKEDAPFTWMLQPMSDEAVESLTRTCLETAIEIYQEPQPGSWTIRRPCKTKKMESYSPTGRQLFPTSPSARRAAFQELITTPNRSCGSPKDDESWEISQAMLMAPVDKHSVNYPEEDDISSMDPDDDGENNYNVDQENKQPQVSNPVFCHAPQPPMTWTLSPIRIQRKRVRETEEQSNGTEGSDENMYPSSTARDVLDPRRVPLAKRRCLSDAERNRMSWVPPVPTTNKSRPIFSKIKQEPEAWCKAAMIDDGESSSGLVTSPPRASSSCDENGVRACAAVVTPETKSGAIKKEEGDELDEGSSRVPRLEVILVVPV